MEILERPARDKMLQDLIHYYFPDPSEILRVLYDSKTAYPKMLTDEELYVFWRDTFCTEEDIIMPDEIDRLIELVEEFPIEL